MENHKLKEETVEIVLLNRNNCASKKVSVFLENTLEQVVESFGYDIALSSKQRNKYSRSVTIKEMGLTNGETFTFREDNILG